MVSNYDNKIISMFTTGDANIYKNHLIKMDDSGEIVEQHLVDSTFDYFGFFGLIEDMTDSTYIAFGKYIDSLGIVNNNEPKAFLLKLDSLGNHIWLKSYSNTLLTISAVKAMDGGFWVCGSTSPQEYCSDGWFLNNDLFLIKTDAFGNEEGRIVFGGSCGNEFASVNEYKQDKVVLVGRLTNTENGPDDMYNGFYYSTLIEQQSNEMLLETTPMKKYLNAYNGNFVDLHYLPNDGYLIVCDNQISPQQGAGTEIVYRWKGCLMKLDMNRDRGT